jgi:hypothetical protein
MSYYSNIIILYLSPFLLLNSTHTLVNLIRLLCSQWLTEANQSWLGRAVGWDGRVGQFEFQVVAENNHSKNATIKRRTLLFRY